MVLAEGQAPAGADAAKTVKKQTKCPVMGGAVNTNVFADVKGKRIYMCCAGCAPALRADPEK